MTDHGPKVAEAKRLRKAHSDCALDQLSYSAIEQMASYWCERQLAHEPDGKQKNQLISVETVKNMLKHLRRFLEVASWQ